jgi:hypothetical protein
MQYAFNIEVHMLIFYMFMGLYCLWYESKFLLLSLLLLLLELLHDLYKINKRLRFSANQDSLFFRENFSALIAV